MQFKNNSVLPCGVLLQLSHEVQFLGAKKQPDDRPASLHRYPPQGGFRVIMPSCCSTSGGVFSFFDIQHIEN